MNLSKLFVPVLILFASCNSNTSSEKTEATTTPAEVPAPKRVTLQYTLLAPKDSIKAMLKNTDSISLSVLTAVNRADRSAMATLDTILVPANMNEEVKQYLPFPFAAPFLKDVNKIIFFSYPAQVFAAYERGRLVYTGPTSMGRKADQTPTGLFYTNWKAEQTTSTFNDEWDLKWNFNIENKLGVGFHQYAMPGYPASHSCLRMTEKDAKYMYEWADQWVLEGTDNIIAHGTPVIVFGSYPFGSPKPWLALAQNPEALTITETALQEVTQQHLADIMQKQQKRTKAGK